MHNDSETTRRKLKYDEVNKLNPEILGTDA